MPRILRAMPVQEPLAGPLQYCQATGFAFRGARMRAADEFRDGMDTTLVCPGLT
jgi:hypothetical protein